MPLAAAGGVPDGHAGRAGRPAYLLSPGAPGQARVRSVRAEHHEDAMSVVGIRGQFVPKIGEPVAEVVAVLEAMLAEAKAGRLLAAAIAYDTLDGVCWRV